ncbi:hypothetical protein N9Y42_07825 [Mariniblastus sp.]|nr:hypothetical protein [Mariniblastus sp.]
MSKKETTLGQSYRRTIVVVILLIAVHYALLRWLDGNSAFAVLTSSGNDTPMVTTVAAMAFVGLRMYLYLVVPGMAVARMCSATLRWYSQQGAIEASPQSN